MIPFIDLKAQYRLIEERIQDRMQNVFEHGRFIMGPEIEELEKELAAHAGTGHCLACSSGTDALLMALMALGVGPGDKIVTSPFTFVATGEAVALVGATPVFCDIDPATFNLDPACLEATLAELEKDHAMGPDGTVKGIITVDIFGQPCDYQAITALAERYGLFIIQDAAQSFGASYKGSPVPSQGLIGCTSFFPAKPLGCYGDGGAVFTDDPELQAIMSSIRIHGQGTDKYDNVRVGLNARMDTFQAAILLEKLAIFPEEVGLRNRVAERYTTALAPLAPRLVTPAVAPDSVSVWAQYSVLAESNQAREALCSALADAGIPTAAYYPLPLHRQKAFEKLGYARGDMPVSDDASDRIFSLPMHPYLEPSVADTVVQAMTSVLER